MKILLIDTCGATGSLALADTDLSPSVVATASLPGRTASERLVPAVKDLTVRHGISLQSLDAVVVVHGPGSFTGMRVGVSAAKGLCEALNLAVVAISRLAVLAHLTSTPLGGTHVHALLDAGRGEFYSGDYDGGICLREALLTRDGVLAAVNRAVQKDDPGVLVESVEPAQVLAACEPAVVRSLAPLTVQLVADPTAEDALPLALRRIQEGLFDDAALLDANYLRRTDAEIFAKPRSTGGASQVTADQGGIPVR